MTKEELVAGVQDELRGRGYESSKASASMAIDCVTAAIVTALGAGEEVKLAGLGRFGIVERSARTTKVFGEVKEVPASKQAKFYPAPSFKAQLNA